MSYEITCRSLSPREAKELAAQVGGASVISHVGCLTALGAFFIWCGSSLGSWLGSLFGAESVGSWIGAIIFVLPLLCALPILLKEARKRSHRVRGDLCDNQVEEITVDTAEVVELAPLSDDEPVFCFQIDRDTLLVLKGQWLRNPATYGGTDRDYPDDDSGEDFANGLTGRYSFPRTRFKLVRVPKSGEVLSLSLSGRYLPPTRTVDVFGPDGDTLWSSALFSGRLDDIRAALDQGKYASQVGEPRVRDYRAGFSGDAWQAADALRAWKRFEARGPSYSLPARRYAAASPIPSCPGTLYMGLYPRPDFASLAEFATFQFYSSSVQQDLLQSGEVDMECFHPEPADTGVEHMASWWRRVLELPEGGDFAATVHRLGLPDELGWLSRLTPAAVIFSVTEGELELLAETPGGFLTVFTLQG